jgi:hypothetical protein
MEEWKKINNFPDYEVSSAGRVKSLKRGTEKVMALWIRPDGYTDVTLRKDGIKITKIVHRLVGEAFISNSDDKSEIDHINRIRNDNRVENLRWVTSNENKVNTKDRLNSSGHHHICVHEKGFQVQVYRNYRYVFRKKFKTLEEAIKARDEFLTSSHCVSSL